MVAVAALLVVVRGRRTRVLAVPNERLKTAPEHFTQVAFERLHRRKSVCHLSIINECACAS
jgi:hypothetical protein